MSWNAMPPTGLSWTLSGGFLEEYSDVPRIHATETLFCAGEPPLFIDATIPYRLIDGEVLIATDSYAADHLADFAAYDFVQVFTTGAWHGGGAFGGWYSCADRRDGIPEDPGLYVDVRIAGGPSTELRDDNDGTLRPILSPIGTADTPDSDGLFMRPTAHTWPGQDPANDANRSVWLPSELSGAIGAISLYHTLGASGYSLQFGTGLRGLNILDTDVEEPVICFV